MALNSIDPDRLTYIAQLRNREADAARLQRERVRELIHQRDIAARDLRAIEDEVLSNYGQRGLADMANRRPRSEDDSIFSETWENLRARLTAAKEKLDRTKRRLAEENHSQAVADERFQAAGALFENCRAWAVANGLRTEVI